MNDYDLESWEAHSDFHDRCDYPGLVAHCQAEVSRCPEDLHAVERLGEALVLDGEFEKAIAFLEPYHRNHPSIEAFSHQILDALYALGRSDNDFQWTAKPVIFEIGSEVADFCYEYLRPKRLPRTVGDLYCQLIMRAYLKFTEDQLEALLLQDLRFTVDPFDKLLGARVSVARESRRRR